MKNKVKVLMGALLALLTLGACQSFSSKKDEVWVADVRSAMTKDTPFSMKEDVVGIEYIPLETTDSCLISNVTYLVMDDDSLFKMGRRTRFLNLPDRESLSVR